MGNIHQLHYYYSLSRYCRDGSHLRHCSRYPCLSQMFKCPRYYCVPSHKVCNQVIDCPGGEDELDCEGRVCPTMLRCASRLCVSLDYLCDGMSHCPQDEDEIACSPEPCPNNCVCLGHSIYCNNANLDALEGWKLITVHNSLSKIANISGIEKLVRLNISYNHISNIDEKFPFLFSNLLSLDMSMNQISSLPEGVFIGLVNLTELFLSFNPLTQLDNDVFLGLSKLQTLTLDRTKIHELCPAAMQKMGNLHFLSIHYSSVHTINVSLDESSMLLSVDLSNNPLKSITLYKKGYSGSENLTIITSDPTVCCKIGWAICMGQSGNKIFCDRALLPVWLATLSFVFACAIILINASAICINQRHVKHSLKYVLNQLHAADIIGATSILLVNIHNTVRISSPNGREGSTIDTVLCRITAAVTQASMVLSAILSAWYSTARAIKIASFTYEKVSRSKYTLVSCVIWTVVPLHYIVSYWSMKVVTSCVGLNNINSMGYLVVINDVITISLVLNSDIVNILSTVILIRYIRSVRLMIDQNISTGRSDSQSG